MIEIDANGYPINFRDRDNYKVFMQLQIMNQKMDRQIKYLETIIALLRQREDDGK